MVNIALLALVILLILYILYALVKFFDFFYLKYDTRIDRIRTAYKDGGRIIRIFDDAMLVFMLIMLGLLFVTGVEYLSFITGLLVGMTLIQIYFHRFNNTLPVDKSPEPPVSAIKLMSYSIQANPGKAWKELIFMTVLLIWAIYMLVTQGFGLFR